MQIVLGLNTFHADSSISIIKKNNLIYAQEEEKTNRVKHYSGFPLKTLKNLFNKGIIKPHEITDITINIDPKVHIFRKVLFFLKNYLFGKKKYEIFFRLKKRYSIKHQLNLLGLKKAKMHYIEHHLSHLSSAYYASGFENAVGLSIDGFGDFSSLAIAICKKNNIDIKERIFFPHSLGLFYEACTQFSGFQFYGEEYKLMGMSSFGKPAYSELILNNLFIEDDSLYKLNLDFFNHHKPNYVYSFSNNLKRKKLFSEKIKELFPFYKAFDIKKPNKELLDFSSSVQNVYEYFLNKILIHIKSKYNLENIVFAGGCALNSKANRLLYRNRFKKIFIPYNPGDGGGSIGSSLYFLKNKKIKNLQNAYLGNSYRKEEFKNIIKNNTNFFFKEYDNFNDLCEKISQKLYNKKVVGWFQGQLEFGARALGNRSILADPSNPNVKDLINSKIKKRESFRPFAPVIMEEQKKNWFTTGKRNLYMTDVENVLESKRKLIPGVVHVDGSARVQTINFIQNKKLYNLLAAFYKKTGIPLLLNTSFNENEPIVDTPNQALNCFIRTDLDVLVIENFILEKKF